MNALDELFKQHGRAAVARAIGVARPSTYKWDKRLPAERAVQINQVYGVPLHDLRPDLWEKN